MHEKRKWHTKRGIDTEVGRNKKKETRSHLMKKNGESREKRKKGLATYKRESFQWLRGDGRPRRKKKSSWGERSWRWEGDLVLDLRESWWTKKEPKTGESTQKREEEKEGRAEKNRGQSAFDHWPFSFISPFFFLLHGLTLGFSVQSKVHPRPNTSNLKLHPPCNPCRSHKPRHGHPMHFRTEIAPCKKKGKGVDCRTEKIHPLISQKKKFDLSWTLFLHFAFPLKVVL